MDFQIYAIDYLLDHSPAAVMFDPILILQNMPFNASQFEMTEDEKIAITRTHYKKVLLQAEALGYIYHPTNNSSSSIFALTILGREVKQKGGHIEYWEYIKRKDNALFESVRYAKEAAGAAIESANAAKSSVSYTKKTMWLIAIYTGLTFILVVTTIVMCNQNKRETKSQSIAPNSTKDIPASKRTDTVR